MAALLLAFLCSPVVFILGEDCIMTFQLLNWHWDAGTTELMATQNPHGARSRERRLRRDNCKPSHYPLVTVFWSVGVVPLLGQTLAQNPPISCTLMMVVAREP